jgi:YbbR domain-containing protein
VINFDSVPEGYVARLVDYSPKIVTISGSPDLLARLPDTVDTDSIDLTNRTEAFTAEVRLTLPVEGLVVLNNTTISVQISIDARMGAREFDNVPVTFSGLGAGLSARAIPSRVSVLVNGPQPLLEQLTTENIAVTVDARSLRAGAYDVEPVATLNVGSVSAQDIRVLPITIGVIVSEEPHTPSPTPAVTPSSPDS